MAIYYFCKKGIEYNNTIIIIEIKMKTKLIESLDNVDAIFVTKDKKIYNKRK